MQRLFLILAIAASLVVLLIVVGGFLGESPAASVSPVLLVGLDGATFDRILPLAAQGRLPNLSALPANRILGWLVCGFDPF